MSSPNLAPNPLQQPFLITSKEYPEDLNKLVQVLTKDRIDIASNVNKRVIGTYEKIQTVTGEQWFNDIDTFRKRQTFRQVYTAPSILNPLTSIPHNIPITSATRFTHIYATASSTTTSNIRFVPIPYVNVTTPGDDIQISVSDTDIRIVVSTGNWTGYSVIVVLEYLLN